MVSFVVEGREDLRMGRGAAGDVEVVHKWSPQGGGLLTAKFALSMPANGYHSELRPGARVLVRHGTTHLGWGRVTDDYDPRSGQVTIDGEYRRAERFNALDEFGAVTTNPAVAVAQANPRGMGWNGVGNLPDAALSVPQEEAQQIRTVADLLNEWCRLHDLVWYLDVDNRPVLTANPETVSHQLRPGTPVMRRVAGEYITTMSVRYVVRTQVTDPGTDEIFGTDDDGEPEPTRWATATATLPVLPPGITEVEDYEDLTNLGLLHEDPLEAAEIAQGYAEAILAARGPRMWFGEPVEVTAGQVTTNGGQSPALWVPLHGRRVRHHGVWADGIGLPGLGMTLTWVVGRSTYRPAEGVRLLEPMEISPAATLPKLIGWLDSPANPKNRKTA